MTDIIACRDVVQRQLRAFLGDRVTQVILAEQNSLAPPYPYVTMKVTSYPSVSVNQWQADRFENNTRIYTTPADFTISFTFLSDDIDVSAALAHHARVFFEVDAHRSEAFKAHRMHVQDITRTTDRTLVLFTDFEPRTGFDVQFGVVLTERRTIDAFDRVELQQIDNQ